MIRLRAPLLLVVALATVACGKEGPPLPPLHLVPEAPSNVLARRTANEVRFSFALPAKNANGPGTVDLHRIEIFAATLAPGAMPIANRDLLTEKRRVGTIEVRQPSPEGGESATKPDDKRPAPGDAVTFVEFLDAAKLTPEPVEAPPVPPATAAAPATVPAAPAAPTFLRRVYSIRGVARNGRPGQAAARIEVPLGELPAGPTDVAAKFTESALTLSWTAPTVATGTAQFNVYAADAPAPLNPAPLATPSFTRDGVEFGKEECFVVRSVIQTGAVAIESEASPRVCVTPVDTFAPSAPATLNTVASPGVISLIWSAATSGDLAGYIVLRGEAPGDKLQPLTPAPVKETTFRDTTVKAGVRYVYAVVAVDTAGNRSAESPRAEDSAR